MQVLFLSRIAWSAWSLIFIGEMVEQTPIIVVIIENTIGRLSISSSSTTLLNVAFKSFGHRVVNNEPDILFVDSHAKRYCCNYHTSFSLHPGCLNLISYIVMKICMIEITRNVVRPKLLRELGTLNFRCTVNDSRSSF